MGRPGIDNPGGAAPEFPGELPVTGQLTQYLGELDDGFYEMGLDRGFEILTTGFYAGTTNITVNAKTDVHSNNCVLDLVTGKMWSRYVSASVGPGNDGRMVWSGAPDDIFAFVTAANAAALAGWTDWRVPNVFELYLLGDFETPSGVPDAVAFPGWPNTQIWTATTDPVTTTRSMYVNHHQAQAYYAARNTAYFTALVRGGTGP